MAIGERIRFFRVKRGLTQKKLGQILGYPEKSADIRVAQYENGSRRPKAAFIKELADAFGIQPAALDVPDIESPDGLMHTLFALEDLYGLRVCSVDGEPFLYVDQDFNEKAAKLRGMLFAWSEQVSRLESGMISREEYDLWRYCYPVYRSTPTSKENFLTAMRNKVNDFR